MKENQKMGQENMTTVIEEREINLLDLIVEILIHWRMLLIVMFAGGVIFGGYSYIRSSQNINAQLNLETEQTGDSYGELLKEQLDEGQLNNVTIALTYYKIYEEKLAYQQQAVLMQIDPFHVPRVELTFWVESDDMEKTYNIEKAYEDQLADVALWDYVKEWCNIKDDLSGLIFLEQPNYDHQQGSNIVRVQIIYKDADTCYEMAEAVVKYVQQLKNKLENTVGKHDIVLLSQSQSETVNSYILSQQQNYVIDILTAQSNYIRSKDAFSDIELQYYNYLLSTEEAKKFDSYSGSTIINDKDATNYNQEAQDEAAHIMRPKVSIRYTFLGIFVLTAMYILVIFLRYILNNKLRTLDNLQQLYHIPQLGLITAFPKKYFLSTIDQRILKLRYHNRRKLSPEESLNIAIVLVKMAAKEQKINHVCLIGCNLGGHAIKFCEQARDMLKKENITVKILDNILCNVTAMENLQDVESVVLVETAGATLYDDILRELQLLNRQKIRVLGGIIVE